MLTHWRDPGVMIQPFTSHRLCEFFCFLLIPWIMDLDPIDSCMDFGLWIWMIWTGFICGLWMSIRICGCWISWPLLCFCSVTGCRHLVHPLWCCFFVYTHLPNTRGPCALAILCSLLHTGSLSPTENSTHTHHWLTLPLLHFTTHTYCVTVCDPSQNSSPPSCWVDIRLSSTHLLHPCTPATAATRASIACWT